MVFSIVGLKTKIIVCITIFSVQLSMHAQDDSELPYSQIPEAPQMFTAGTVASRVIDGLGFRYYWATEGLTSADLEYKLNVEGRSTLETIRHIYGLSTIIRDVALKVPHTKETFKKPLTYTELRKLTVLNLKKASDILRVADDLESFNIIFSSPEGDQTIPFWNVINGPIEDAVWHCGQIASFRRASGNPIHSKVNHFRGTVN